MVELTCPGIQKIVRTSTAVAIIDGCVFGAERPRAIRVDQLGDVFRLPARLCFLGQIQVEKPPTAAGVLDPTHK